MSSFKCHRCGFQHSQRPKFEQHLASVHGVVDVAQEYVSVALDNVSPKCQCGCGEATKWLGWGIGFSEFVRGHNGRKDSVYLDPAWQAATAQKRRERFALGQQTSWNDGLTKESSDVVRAAAKKASRTLKERYTAGVIVPWQQGLTKETNNSLRQMSETKLGSVPWNAGLTKETSPIIFAASQKISAKMMGRQRLSEEEVVSRVKAGGFELVSSVVDYRQRRVARLDVRCNECGEVSSKSLAMIEETPVCFRCHPRESRGQLELYEFVRSLCPDTVLSDRVTIPPQELDVFVSSRKFAVEFNGLYWHSDAHKPDSYHADKLKRCTDAGIRLFNVFSDDWRDRRHIVEAMIRHRLGMTPDVIGARQCRVACLGSHIRREFFDANHIDGDTRATTAFGLLIGDSSDNIVCAMSLRRPFHARYGDSLEVARFCSKLGTSVRGGLSRLTKACLSYAKEDEGKAGGLVTYTDGRVGDGNAWTAAGWTDIGTTPPRFWWTDGHDRFDRFSVRADKKNGLTERDVASRLGVYRVYGCHNRIMTIA